MLPEHHSISEKGTGQTAQKLLSTPQLYVQHMTPNPQLFNTENIQLAVSQSYIQHANGIHRGCVSGHTCTTVTKIQIIKSTGRCCNNLPGGHARPSGGACRLPGPPHVAGTNQKLLPIASRRHSVVPPPPQQAQHLQMLNSVNADGPL